MFNFLYSNYPEERSEQCPHTRSCLLPYPRTGQHAKHRVCHHTHLHNADLTVTSFLLLTSLSVEIAEQLSLLLLTMVINRDILAFRHVISMCIHWLQFRTFSIYNQHLTQWIGSVPVSLSLTSCRLLINLLPLVSTVYLSLFSLTMHQSVRCIIYSVTAQLWNKFA